jgi:phage repressor protein C with HTH and peptisase S24 domain
MHAEGYAKAFDVTAAWLLWGDRPAPQSLEFKLIGQVGAGGESHYISSYEQGDGESIFFVPEEITAVLEINGNSMLPRYRHRDKLFLGYRYDDPSPLIGKDVFVQLKEDGRKLFKELQPGSRQGVWDLLSMNADYEPIRDVELDWACPVKWVKV